MANTIKIKAGSGTPTTSDIVDKELAFDRSADKLYINDNGTIVDLSGSASLDTEAVQDIVGAMFSGNTETRITATYQDSDGTIDLVVDDLDTDTQLTTENVQDIVGAMFSSNTETRISATYQDGDGTIDLVVDDMTTDTNTNQLTTFTLTADSGSNQTIAHGNTLDIAGGTNCTTSVGATDTVTINVDDAFLKNDANDTTSGTITAAGFTTSGSVTSDTLVGNSNNTNTLLFDDDQSGASNMVTLQSINHINVMTDGNNNGTGNFRVYNGSYDTDTADLRFEVTAAGDVNVTGDLQLAATSKLYLDGGGNSYIQEESSDNLIFRAAGGNYLRVTGSNIVLNDPGASYDVRIEGDTDSNLFFTDGSADKVGIGTNSPDTKLDITASGVQGVVINQDGSNADISSRLFFKEQNSTIALYNTGNTFSFRTGATINSTSGTERMHIDTSGIDVNGSVIADSLDISGDVDIDGTTNLDAVDIDGVITAADGSASNPQYSFGADTNSGMFRVSSDVVGIAAAGNSRFTVKGNGIKAPGGSLGVNTDPNSTDGMIHATNDIVAFSSDKRLKENIRPIENALDKVSKLSGFVYNWNELANQKAQYDMDKDYVGVYAQDVEEVQPEAVDLAPFDNDGEDKSISGDNYLTVQYEKLVPLLIESIKELKAEIEELKK